MSKQKATDRALAVSKFIEMMLSKKGLKTALNWNLKPEEIEPELTIVSNTYGVPKGIIKTIVEVR